MRVKPDVRFFEASVCTKKKHWYEASLRPCAKDSDDFAETAGLDYFSETSVGEFALSGR